MKSILFAIWSILSSTVYCQLYDDLVEDKSKKPEMNNVYFVPGETLIYSVEIFSDTTKIFLEFEKNDWILSSEDTSGVVVKEMTFTTLLPTKKSDRTNKHQTEIVSTFGNPIIPSFQTTGVVDNPSNLWLHPPIRAQRSFPYLELCPFPYIKLPCTIGLSWTDRLKIHDFWIVKEGPTWKGSIVLDISYKIIGMEAISYAGRKISCFKIEGIAINDEVGISTSLATYFHPEIGIIRMEYHAPNNLKVDFHLLKKKSGEVMPNAQKLTEQLLLNRSDK